MGIGSEIAASGNGGTFRLTSMRRSSASAQKDVPLPYAANLEKLALPQVDDIVACLPKKVCYSRNDLQRLRGECAWQHMLFYQRAVDGKVFLHMRRKNTNWLNGFYNIPDMACRAA
jgi:hypothetical protein